MNSESMSYCQTDVKKVTIKSDPQKNHFGSTTLKTCVLENTTNTRRSIGEKIY
jgi:hypothetical protein